MGILDGVRGAAGGFARANLGLLDKTTGPARRLAGNALGSDRLRRQGRDDDLAGREADLDATNRNAERRKREELDRAATAARRQFARR